jgi:hypothetical protein
MWPVRRADNLTTFMCRLPGNMGASASRNAQGLSRPVMGLLYLYFTYFGNYQTGSMRVQIYIVPCVPTIFKACWLLYIPPGLTFKNSACLLQCIDMFCESRKRNSNFFFIHDYMIGLYVYNRGGKCLQRGTD